MPVRRRRRRSQSGQAITETVMAVLLLCLVLFALVQVAYLYMGQMIAHHTAHVTARSHVVGFNRRIVARACEVGSIGMAGHITAPPAYTGMTPAELGAVEPMLIERFLQENGYTMWYQHWGRIQETVPANENAGLETITIQVANYPLEMPMHRAYTRADAVNFDSDVRMFNHAYFYLE